MDVRAFIKFKRGLVFVLLVIGAASHSLYAGDKIKIAATTSTFASIAEAIAGEEAEYYFIASPNRDIHFVEPTPKDVLKVRKADVFVHGGLDLEVWRGPLLDAAGKAEFISGQRAIDVSRGISLLEVPQSLSRVQGDIHAFGNPHYWLDPLNAAIIAENIAGGLARLYPEHAAFFRANAGAFKEKIGGKMDEWQRRLAAFKGTPVVVYHNTWPYFLARFGLVQIGTLQPKPGIAPSPKHLSFIRLTMKEHNVKVIIQESYFEIGTAKKLAKEQGAEVLVLPQAVGEVKEAKDYFETIGYSVNRLAEALSSAREAVKEHAQA